MIGRRALMLGLVLLVGCVPIAPRQLVWPGPDLVHYEPPAIPAPPTGPDTVGIMAGDRAPFDGLLVDPAYLTYLEIIAFDALPELRQAVDRCEPARLQDRAYASEEYERAVQHLRRQLNLLGMVCAAAGVTVGGASAGAGAACGAL